MNIRLDGFNTRLDSFETRLERIETDAHDTRREFSEKLDDMGRRVASLEHKWAYLTGGTALLAVRWTVTQFVMSGFDITVQPRP